jgi:hypothetical protein
VVYRTAPDIRLAIDAFLDARGPAGLVVVYLSCHGLLDKQDRLYFAAADTRKDRLAATGIEAAWLWDRLEECRANSQVVILDCCNSGAFARPGGKSEEAADLRLRERFVTQGRGRAVLTASRANQRSWEGEAAGPSVFTSALVDGLRTGAADLDRDGYISVEEAYRYAYRKVIDSGAGQVPQHSISAGEGTLLLARNPTGIAITPAPLTEDLRAALDSPHPAVRLGAVNALGTWLTGSDPAKALGAEEALRLIADNEIFAIASAARAYLGDVQVAAPPAPAVPAAATGRSEATPAAAPRRMAAAETRVQRAARRTGSLARWGLIAGFLALLIALGVYSVAILQSSAQAYPLEAVVVVCAVGIPCALVGARKNVIAASIILWNLSWFIVHCEVWLPVTTYAYGNRASVQLAIYIVGAAGNAVLSVWVTAAINVGRLNVTRRVLFLFTGLLVIPPSLAAIGYTSHIPSPLWDAVASLGFVALLAGIPVLTRMVR